MWLVVFSPPEGPALHLAVWKFRAVRFNKHKLAVKKEFVVLTAVSCCPPDRSTWRPWRTCTWRSTTSPWKTLWIPSAVATSNASSSRSCTETVTLSPSSHRPYLTNATPSLLCTHSSFLLLFFTVYSFLTRSLFLLFVFLTSILISHLRDSQLYSQHGPKSSVLSYDTVFHTYTYTHKL